MVATAMGNYVKAANKATSINWIKIPIIIDVAPTNVGLVRILQMEKFV